MVRSAMLVALVALSGCGLKKQVEALTDQVVFLTEAVERRNHVIAAHQAAVAELEANVSALGDEITELEAAVAAKESDLDAARERASLILSDRGALRREVADMKEALAELQERKRHAEERVARFRELVDRFKQLIDAGTLEVKIVDGRMVVALATDVLFGSGSAALSSGGDQALAEVAAVLATIDERRFQVEGHTDDVPISNEKYPSNWYLASGRAIGVVEHLVASGMDPAQLSAASFGEHRPVSSNRTDEGRSLNRRIEIVLVPDLSDLPGFRELESL